MNGYKMTSDQINESKSTVKKQMNHKHASDVKLEKKTHNLHSTIPVSQAHVTTSTGNAFLSPNSPDVIKMCKMFPIVGLGRPCAY